MGSLQYAGKPSTNLNDLATKRTVNTVIAATSPNQETVEADIEAAVKGRATKQYVDQQDSRYAPVSEYVQKDASRNVPKSAINTPGGPTTLPITTLRLPTLGSGYVMGPYGWTSVDRGATSTGGAVQVASLATAAIPQGTKFWPLCFGQVAVASADTGGMPLVEMRSGGGLLLSTGRGRTMFIGEQGVTAMPTAFAGWVTSNGGPLVVNMLLSDLKGRSVSVRGAVGGSVYVLVAL